MNLTQSRKDYWIHLNPIGADNFMIHGKTYSEPKLDEKLGHYVVTDEGRMCNDRLTCVNSIAKSFLPEALWDSVKPGMRAHVYNYTFWELKNENDEVVLPIAQKTDYKPDTYFEMQQFTDRLIFGLRGKAELHERYSTFNTRQDDPENPLKVQYVNRYGQVLTHNCSSVTDAYVMIGLPGDMIRPKNIATLWGSDAPTARKLDSMLIEAYMMGIRFIQPPEDDTIHFDVKVINNDIIKLIPQSDYYGFAENLIMSARKDFKSDPNLGVRSLDRCIIGALLSYRWFFNKPDLKVSLSLIHDENLEDSSSWDNKKEYAKYMKSVNTYAKSGLATLTKRINSKVDIKTKGYKEDAFFIPKKFLNKEFQNREKDELE